MTEEEILLDLNSQEKELKLDVAEIFGSECGNEEKGSVKPEEIMLLTAKFNKDGKVMYFVVNNSEEDIEFTWKFEGKDSVEVWDPSDGSVSTVKTGEKIGIISYRGKFFVFE